MMARRCWTIAAAILLAGCTVKEERSACPCLLNLDFDEVIAEGRFTEAVATVGPSPGTPLEQERIEMAQYEGVGYELSVPRRVLMTSVVCGCPSSSTRASSVEAGTSPLMAFAARVHCDSDSEEVKVQLHKQYCRVTLLAEVLEKSDLPTDIILRAQTSSLNLYDLTPCGEELVAALDADMKVNIPRQSPSATILLEFRDENGELLYESDLGAKMAASGYDWTAEDLADIEVKVDWARLQCSVTILDWEEDSEYRQIDI